MTDIQELEQRLDDLESENKELRKENKILKARLDGITKCQDALSTILVGDMWPPDAEEELATRLDKSLIADFFERQRDLESLEEKSTEAKSLAQGAIRRATTEANTKQKKTDMVRILTRNVLVKRAAQGKNVSSSALTTTEVQERLEDRADIKWQTVIDGWNKLAETWPQFYETKKDGVKALNVRKDEITPSLAQTVQADLEVDGLAKRLVGEKPETPPQKA